MRRKTARHPARGFTLVEVLAALILVALVLPAAMQGVSLATQASADAHRRQQAAALAHDKLSELIVTGGWSSASTEGDFGEDYPTYRWTLTVEDWEGFTTRRVTVQVLWESRGMERTLSMSTLVYAGAA